MNKDNAAQYLPLVQALAEGRTVQFLNCEGAWEDTPGPTFSHKPDKYRIKPEPRPIYVWHPHPDEKKTDCGATYHREKAESWVSLYGGHITEMTE